MEPGGVADSLLSGACVLFTLAMYSTGLSDLRHMRMTRSVDNVQFLPFLTTDINNLSWLSYGALKGDGILIFVNATGAVLQTLYILVYVHYCPRKRPVLLQTATLVGVLLLGFGYFWLLVPNLETQLQQLGLFCSGFTISQDHSDEINPASLIPTHHCHPPHLCLLDPLWVSAGRSLHHGAQPTRDPHQPCSPLAFLEVLAGARQELSAPANLRQFT
ncbi:sugar transporter SWEET1 isoform X4 [Canis lupus baileyi]|uniref:sugar transporter SWEET1 isoform X4 n=1 Tax=Canis lupus familiaris TaxID=9615 RepID=UPI0003ADFB2C|nr:sugar transporter SWEET1 isoform X4 [Canis lupus familiaris]XP_038399069.1 sugar transporter SWEET1 isoform X4 [Canis lupus familiaris]XP_038527901.1 sugar transporter SWEET1 isoform X4 [Canis lupus familiaris]XP_048968544.1 sugar transporter SWEET1 isoform X4 [Canis lupus dingo]|eukprot:XP_005622808.1 sugar transporter SWEET1 isoform X4 [Canis lupus familiaris]